MRSLHHWSWNHSSFKNQRKPKPNRIICCVWVYCMWCGNYLMPYNLHNIPLQRKSFIRFSGYIYLFILISYTHSHGLVVPCKQEKYAFHICIHIHWRSLVLCECVCALAYLFPLHSTVNQHCRCYLLPFASFTIPAQNSPFFCFFTTKYSWVLAVVLHFTSATSHRG